jgi:cis-L-3-hydroxyproline dehydratase
MRISRIELYNINLPYSGGVYKLSGGRTYESFDASIVRVVCDDGTEGWGESTPFGSTYIAAHALGTRAGIAELAPALLGHDPLDAERITACLADRRPGEFFIVDANGGLIPETALRMIQLLPHGLDFALEAPCATWRETMSLRRRCPYPIVVDELAQLDQDLALIAAQDVADGIGLKISKAGGLTPGRRHRDICRAARFTMSVQETAGSSIAFAAIIHLGATVPTRLLRCVLNCEDMVALKTAKIDAVFTGGGVLPGGSPGLGITVDEDVLGEPTMTWGD